MADTLTTTEKRFCRNCQQDRPSTVTSDTRHDYRTCQVCGTTTTDCRDWMCVSAH